MLNSFPVEVNQGGVPLFIFFITFHLFEFFKIDPHTNFVAPIEGENPIRYAMACRYMNWMQYIALLYEKSNNHIELMISKYF